MNNVTFGQVTNAEVYLNENLLVGRFKELTFPELEATEVKHETLGQIAVLLAPGRPLKELKGKASVQFMDRDLMPMIYNPTRIISLATHHFVDIIDETGVNPAQGYRVVTHLSAFFKKAGGKAMKLGDNVEGEYDLVFSKFVQSVPGMSVPIIEIDINAQIYNINGAPVWSRY